MKLQEALDLAAKEPQREGSIWASGFYKGGLVFFCKSDAVDNAWENHPVGCSVAVLTALVQAGHAPMEVLERICTPAKPEFEARIIETTNWQPNMDTFKLPREEMEKAGICFKEEPITK